MKTRLIGWVPTSVLAIALPGLVAAGVGHAGETKIQVKPAEVTTGSDNATLAFSLQRSGDLDFPAWLAYKTVDGSAKAGEDYSATAGVLRLPAGEEASTLPVKVLGRDGVTQDKQFDLYLTGVTVGGQTPSFEATSLKSGSRVRLAVAADINGDGKPDIIAAKNNPGTVSVLLNTRQPGDSKPVLGQFQDFPVSGNPVAITTADINRDGKVDVIAANAKSGTLSVLLNTTDPSANAAVSFAKTTVTLTGADPRSLAALDIDGDGLVDLAVGDQTNDTVSVLLNRTTPGDSTAAFPEEKTLPVGKGPSAVVGADVDADGVVDLISANAEGGTVTVLRNKTARGAGAPDFATPRTFAAGAVSAVAAADINGDGRIDIITANPANEAVSVFINEHVANANVQFLKAQSFAVDGAPQDIMARDINADGRVDLITSSGGTSHHVSALLNDTPVGTAVAAFSDSLALPDVGEPGSLFAVDFNGDGKLDLLADNAGADGGLSVLLNTSGNTSTGLAYRKTQLEAGGTPADLIATDVNSDGQSDLVSINRADNKIAILINEATGDASTAAFSTPQILPVAYDVASATSADLNGDGRMDLVACDKGNAKAIVLLNKTSPDATKATFAVLDFEVGTDPKAVAAADVNGDGRKDLVTANAGGASVSVLINKTTPGEAPVFDKQQLFPAGQHPRAVTAADVNRDGKLDLVVGDMTSSQGIVVLLNKTPVDANSATFGAPSPVGSHDDSSVVVTGDINGDGKVDLVATDITGHSMWALLNTTGVGATTVSYDETKLAIDQDQYPVAVRIADVDGDGKNDVIYADSPGTESGNGPSAGYVTVLLNKTEPDATTPAFASKPASWLTGKSAIAIAVADINGDGREDLISADKLNGALYLLLNKHFSVSLAKRDITGTIHYVADKAPPPDGDGSGTGDGGTGDGGTDDGGTNNGGSSDNGSPDGGDQPGPNNNSGGTHSGGGTLAFAGWLLLGIALLARSTIPAPRRP